MKVRHLEFFFFFKFPTDALFSQCQGHRLSNSVIIGPMMDTASNLYRVPANLEGQGVILRILCTSSGGPYCLLTALI